MKFNSKDKNWDVSYFYVIYINEDNKKKFEASNGDR